MTSGELAKFLGIHRSTVMDRLSKGQIPEPAVILTTGVRLWSPKQATQILNDRIYNYKGYK